MDLVPDAYYKTPKGNIIKYSFPMQSKNSKLKHFMFWDYTKNCTVVFSELEIPGLKIDEGANLIYG